MAAAVFEAQPRARDEIAYGARHQGFARSGHCNNAGRGVHRDPADVVVRQLDFAGVKAAAYREAERLHPSSDAPLGMKKLTPGRRLPIDEIEGHCHGLANEQTIDVGGPAKLRARPNITDDMRSGPDQRSRGRFNSNRPFRPQPRVPQSNQTFDSNSPDIRVRGTAQQIFERYVALAREAATTGDRIAAENFYQHAEHYFRINNARREGNSQHASRPTTPADVTTYSPETGSSEDGADREQPKMADDYADY